MPDLLLRRTKISWQTLSDMGYIGEISFDLIWNPLTIVSSSSDHFLDLTLTAYDLPKDIIHTVSHLNEHFEEIETNRDFSLVLHIGGGTSVYTHASLPAELVSYQERVCKFALTLPRYSKLETYLFLD